MSKFTDRLWGELVREHGADLAQMPSPVARHRRRAWSLRLVGGTVGLAGVGTALALMLSAASTPPAFAVTKNHDGTVQVEVFRSAGIAGANAKLAALHVRAKIVEIPHGCSMSGEGRAYDYQAQAKVDPVSIPPGQTLVIASRPSGGKIDLAQVGTTPPPGGPNSGNSGNPGTSGGGGSCGNDLSRAGGGSGSGGPPPSGSSGNSGNG